MSLSTAERPRIFTIDEANAMLPLVRAITLDLTNLSKDLRDRQALVGLLRSQHGKRASDVYSDELEQVERELAKDVARMREFVQELLDLGVEPKSATEGLVDFPAFVEGRPAYLCWQLGEPEVAYWHPLDSGFVGRQPLVAGSVAGRDETI